MDTFGLRSDHARADSASRQHRFDRIAITSAFGHPRNPRTWSGAPKNLGCALEGIGVAVESIQPRLSRVAKIALAVRYLASGYGRPHSTEQLLRAAPARRKLARQVADHASRLDVQHVLHTGTFTLPTPESSRGTKHYLYCDQTWALSLRHRPDRGHYTTKAIADFERLERESLAGLEAVFTFGSYVREHVIQHYGLPAERVTAVGSGMGAIEPFFGRKEFVRPHLLFVAKHLFAAKGGPLLLGAFAIALRRRPDLTLTIVGDERSRALVPRHSNIIFRDHLPWPELQQLYRDATLLTQPMLNDPWGQVYLEAMASRTPVLGLARNGLPEILADGRHGFLVGEAEPEPLAEAIIEALRDPDRLSRLAVSGQQHVLTNYTWDRVAQRIGLM